MDEPTSSDAGDRHWDRPWSTDEMRKHKERWSLACDVGLYRHLQKFSEDITTKVSATESSLDSLVEDLKESSIMIDNVTNVSLALANTQFIESRVYEEEIPDKSLSSPPTTKCSPEIDMISVVSESIRQSIAVMDAKYERVEVLASSESEDETEVTPSVILKPQDPYQNRPLPYVIGSEKWRSSSKIGLESSSSESEMAEEEKDSESSEETPPPRAFPSANLGSRSSRSTSTSSSEFDKSHTNGVSSRTDKIYTRSQDTLNSTSEIETPTTGPPRDSKRGPSFAEELAKRLGNVLPVQKPLEDTRDPEASINRSKDDLFGSDNETDSVFAPKGGSLLSDRGGLFDEASQGLWKDKPAPRPTMIPPSLDIPPPINSVDTKPKSAIDDLFGDNESDDSDDIFAPNSKFMSKSDGTEGPQGRVDRVKGQEDNVMTSTPETNTIPNLFEDDEDDSSLFSPIENVRNRSPEAIRNTSRKPPGILINQSDLLSSALGSKLFNRARNDFSDSSENESAEPQKDNQESVNVNENRSTASVGNTSESVVAGNLQVERNEITTDSSGISVHPTSGNSTLGMSLGLGEPQMESTRLLSEEIYRERIASDSLFNPVPRHLENPQNSINDSHIIHNQAQEIRHQDSTRQEDIFDSDDVFGPPPLPKTNSKSKSKVNSLFDDSDSGDDLFSNTSSGSRSQKSADQAGGSHSADKPKITTSARLFDPGVDVFFNRSAPDIDIFAESGTGHQAKLDHTSHEPDKSTNRGVKASAKLFTSDNLFDDDDEDLFTVRRIPPRMSDNSAVKEIPTTGDKSLATASSGAEEGKNDSTVNEKRGTDKNEKSGVSDARGIFGDVDEGDDDSLFGQKRVSQTVISPEEVEGENATDGPVVSKQKSTGDPSAAKIEPPKSLRIRLPGPADESGAPKRAVSGKIANLMGKMGDLKILSPTDTPPVLRRAEEKREDRAGTPDGDAEDGAVQSVGKTQTTTTAATSKDSTTREVSSPSVLDTETAVSFDLPAQVETLSIASKSRARIPAKRRPQSRQARHSALRHSGIDFDSVDSGDSLSEAPPAPESPSHPEEAAIDRLAAPADGNPVKPSNLLSDDKSELSLGKESSMSITKNTLLSPSTDEEDLFDVPPDLPEDPQKEDILFGRAPILSPVVLDETDPKKNKEKKENKENKEKIEKIEKIEKSEQNSESQDSDVSDPLRRSCDALKDPSQLFAFVTKTPSPEKPKDLLPGDVDDSLFSQAPAKKSSESKPKKTFDLFADDDSSGDLFSGPFTKAIGKKPVKEKASLFDDLHSDEDNTGDDLFGSVSSKRSHSKSECNEIADEVSSPSRLSLKGFPGDEEEEDDEELFFDASEKPSDSLKESSLFPSTSKIPKTKLEDIFGDPSSGDDDIFSTKKPEVHSGGGGNDRNYSDGGDIFCKRVSDGPKEAAPSVRKSVTRDLKKTAEKIVEDPLRMFQDE
ncbi:WASH complex subunit FAM21 [Fopius arisanus]|uniref:WASH complex subunit FAM21 n=1 Tax=Fopius arisanus TaxID=64838 RepID=A0A9R1TBU2_9HYME|nr:PREDICTED: WASH complex subunit FAM21 [Fopius arisanus]